MGSQRVAKGRTKDLNGSQGAKGLLLETNIYTKTRRISFQIFHQDKDIKRSSFNHCIKTLWNRSLGFSWQPFGVNYRKSRQLQSKTEELKTYKAKDPS